MKKIHNGKMYNTETAKFICKEESKDDRTSFYYWEKELYCKKTGEFFLMCDGNCGTIFYRTIVQPLTKEEAKIFVEKNGLTEDYIELFGEPEE